MEGRGRPRVLGVGGMLARINRKRGTGKGRAASVSLALAIVLLMTAGSLNVFLGTLTNVVTGGGEPAGQWASGPSWMRRRPRTKDGRRERAKLMTEARRLAKAMLQPAVLRLPRALPSPLPRRLEAVAAATTSCSQRRPRCSPMPSPISQVAGAQPVGWKMTADIYAILPEAMAGDALADTSNGTGGTMADGSIGAVGSVAYSTMPPSTTTRRAWGLTPPTFAIRLTCGPSPWPRATATMAASTKLLNVLRASRALWRPLRR